MIRDILWAAFWSIIAVLLIVGLAALYVEWHYITRILGA